MTTQRFSIMARARSFKYAFDGISSVFKRDHNILIHFFATIAVIVLAIVTKVSVSEALILLFAVGFVWMAELFNTAIEKMMDLVSTQHHPRIKFIKDVSAAAVLVASVTAAVAGCLIFIPKFMI